MKLTTIVADLLLRSEQSGHITAKSLPRGLVVETWVTPRKTQLRLIRRSGIYPSDQEWHTVTAAFPYPVACIPAQLIEGTNRVLSGSWPTPKRLL